MTYFIYSTPSNVQNSIVLILVLIILSGCGIFGKQDEQQKAHRMYITAKQAMLNQNYSAAIENFELLESTYPFNPYSQKASLLLAYLYYKHYDYAKGKVLLDHFIRQNPKNKFLDYAYYLKGLINFNTSKGLFSLIIQHDRSSKDPTSMIEAFNAFKFITEQYPDSRYAYDAKLYTITLRDILALHELRIADFYVKQRAYAGAINRIQYILKYYAGTQYTPPALILLSEAYKSMNIKDSAESTLRILKLNYPDYHKEKVLEITTDDEKKWFSKFKDLSSTITEILGIKPRY